MNSRMDSIFGSLEEIIESFEDARIADPEARIQEFLPDAESPNYIEVLQELVRVDLDHRFRNGRKGSLEDYRTEFPALFESEALISPLAYEEYRLRLSSDEPLEASEFACHYGIDISKWPKDVVAAKASPGPSPQDQHLKPGERLLDFSIVGQLGKGAFSTVYLARQLSLAGRLVVLKVSSVRMNEADRLAKLQHASIVPIYSVHELDQYSVICMPWFGAATLKDVIEVEHGRQKLATGEALLSTVAAFDSRTRTSFSIPGVPVPETLESAEQASVKQKKSPLVSMDFERAALWIGYQLAEGLHHAHVRGILHRDLKPANILVTEDGQPMILDFNLAIEHQAESVTDAIVGGTLPYMSPEQIASIDSFAGLSPSADVYSLGVILYELMTRTLPFQYNAGDRRTMIEERRSGAHGPRKCNSAVSIDTDSIIRKCLEPSLEQRYSSASELAEDLRRHLDHRPLLYAPNRSLKERAGKWLVRNPQLTSSVGLITLSSGIILVLGLILWRMYDHREELLAGQLAARFERQLPSLQGEAFAAAIGQGSREDTIKLIVSAVEPLVDDQKNLQASLAQRLSLENKRQIEEHIHDLNFMIRKLQNESSNSAESSVGVSAEEKRGADRLSNETTASKTSQEAEQMLQAFSLVSENSFPQARLLVKQISASHPERFSALLLGGMLEVEADQFDEAESQLTAAIALQPDSIQAWYQRGVCRLGRKNYRGAADDFTHVLTLDSGRLTAKVSRAIAYQELGRFQEALQDLTDAIEGGFRETRVYGSRAALYRRMGDAEAAARDVKTQLSLQPSDALSWISRGLARLPDSPEAALQDFREAQKLAPSSHEAFRNLSMVLSEYLNRSEEAIEVLNDAIPQYENDPYLWAGRGVLLARAGKREAAHKDAIEASKHSNDALLKYMIACIYSLTSREMAEDSRVAIQWLATSLKTDTSLVRLAGNDKDLAPISKKEEFGRVLFSASELQKQADSLMKK